MFPDGSENENETSTEVVSEGLPDPLRPPLYWERNLHVQRTRQRYRGGLRGSGNETSTEVVSEGLGMRPVQRWSQRVWE